MDGTSPRERKAPVNTEARIPQDQMDDGIRLRNRTVEENLALVHHVARKIQRRNDGLVYDELVSAGVLGLMEAAENFDPERGWAFSTYAAPRIRGAILDDLRKQDHASRSMRTKEKKIARARETLSQRLEREPRDGEVARELDIDLRRLWEWEGKVAMAGRVALEKPVSEEEDGGTTVGDLLVGEDGEAIEEGVNRLQEIEILQDEIARLSEQQRTVLSLYFFEELNLRQIGEVMGLTESRISQIRTAALTELLTSLAHLQEPLAA